MLVRLIIACIPAYNEARDLGPIVIKTLKFVDKVIVCDDGSTDLTSEISEHLGCDVIVHPKRLGKGAALRSLFKRALNLGGEIIVTLDGDGQNDPANIPVLIAPLQKGEVDIVVGNFLWEYKQY